MLFPGSSHAPPGVVSASTPKRPWPYLVCSATKWLTSSNEAEERSEKCVAPGWPGLVLTGMTRARADEHVRGRRRQRFDDILLVALDDLVRGNVVPHAPEFLGRAGRARARHHYFTELQRVRGEIEILLHDSRLERHLNSRRLVPKAACDDGAGL